MVELSQYAGQLKIIRQQQRCTSTQMFERVLNMPMNRKCEGRQFRIELLPSTPHENIRKQEVFMKWVNEMSFSGPYFPTFGLNIEI